ncbi:MAG: DNRLRE domain-containing protein [Hadesarchaea archaeon]|nr:DNRLRE domain-containing protein [Hadesarchaea archaeon]
MNPESRLSIKNLTRFLGSLIIILTLILASLPGITSKPNFNPPGIERIIKLHPTDDVSAPSKTYHASYRFISFDAEDTHVHRAFLKFHLPPIPPAPIMTKISLRMYQTNWDRDPRKTEIRIIENDEWEEEEITWKNQPESGETLATFKTHKGRNKWLEITSDNLTKAITRESRRDKVISLLIREADETSPKTDMCEVASKDHPDNSKWPHIKITYSFPPRKNNSNRTPNDRESRNNLSSSFIQLDRADLSGRILLPRARLFLL